MAWLGIILGTALGILLDNIGAWLAIGVALGAGLEARIRKKINPNKNNFI